MSLLTDPPPVRETALDVLHRVFGFDSFRGHQQMVIDHVLKGGDALVLMPTGGGKSLCYQIPALVRPGLGVVISPLIALMKDQVDALRQAGIRAAFLNSSLPPGEAREVERQVREGSLDMLYVAPERLLLPYCLELLASVRIALFAIDEAHCVSQWGHNFRPDYRQLAILHERFPDVPRLALTATADGPTRKDIVDRLRLDEAEIFVSGFDRPNITYRVVEKRDARAQLLAFLAADHPHDAGIVYCLSRRKVDEIADFLSSNGRLALPYHAGLDADVRARHQQRFLNDEGIIMVATVAFGMGIDKPNVRFVAHLDVPRSLEAYYQETGRAGRDGLKANAWMAYGLGDVLQLKQMVLGSELDDRQKRVDLQKLEALLGFCETASCRRQILLTYFGDAPTEPCGNCDICFEPVKRWNGTVAAQKALSAVYRTGQRFGVQHLIDVLTGKETERVLQRSHNALKTFGVGADIARNTWQSIFRQLVAGGYLSVDMEGHGGLQFGPRATAVVKGEVTVELREERPDPLAGRKAGGAKRASAAPAELGGADAALFEELRRLRLEMAREQALPPYVIFHDTTLVEMARIKPRTLDALSHIPGVGRSKLERYGARFLAVLTESSARV